MSMEIKIRSIRIDFPDRVIENGPQKWTKIPGGFGHRFVMDYIKDGIETSNVTNDMGDGLFSITPRGDLKQILGTCQFHVPDRTKDHVRRFFRRRYKEEIENGAKITFDLSDF